MTRIQTPEPSAALAATHDLLVADWEFSRLPLPGESMQDWASRARRLSLALVPLQEDAPAFYAVRSLDRRILKTCSAFTLAEVVPVLDAAPPTLTFRSTVELNVGVRRFLAQRFEAARRRPVIVVDWGGDARLFEALLPPETALLVLEDIPEIQAELARPFPYHHRRHNALHDAWAIRKGVRAYLDRLR